MDLSDVELSDFSVCMLRVAWGLHCNAIRLELHSELLDCAPQCAQVFVDTDDDVRLARRIQRDVTHRGRDVSGEGGVWGRDV